MIAEPRMQPIDPARLAAGEWCHQRNKTIGEGDISASYSADRIGMGKPVRKPFTWNGSLWVCIGKGAIRNDISAEAYRIVHPQMFDGDTMSYADRTRNGDAARADSNGFYHGMRITHANAEFILCGAPVRFVPGEQEQLTLF